MVPINDHDDNNDDTSLQYNHDLHIIPLILFTYKISEKRQIPTYGHTKNMQFSFTYIRLVYNSVHM